MVSRRLRGVRQPDARSFSSFLAMSRAPRSAKVAQDTQEKPERGRGPRHAKTRRRLAWLVVLIAMVGIVLLVGGLEINQPLTPPTTRILVKHTIEVSGSLPRFPWPAQGEAAIAVPALGLVLPSGTEAPVPIASVTKIMTAYLTLRDHPLAVGAQGPMVPIEADDVAEANTDAENDDTNVPVVAGELLSERQLLDGLMVHSANNFADVLARWDAGSTDAFVEKMNETADQLGMTSTHYSDANGIHPQTVSTAADQLRLASLAMTIPTFGSVVDQPTVTLPMAGLLSNYVKQIGTDGIIGIKSGFTDAAMGCLVLAAERDVGGHQVLVLAAVTSQAGPSPLDAAAGATVPLLDATASALRELQVVKADQRIASVSVKWVSRPVAGVLRSAMSALVMPGYTPAVHMSMSKVRIRVPARAGTSVGTLTVTVGSEKLTARVRTAKPIRNPTFVWRLEHL